MLCRMPTSWLLMLDRDSGGRFVPLLLSVFVLVVQKRKKELTQKPINLVKIHDNMTRIPTTLFK